MPTWLASEVRLSVAEAREQPSAALPEGAEEREITKMSTTSFTICGTTRTVPGTSNSRKKRLRRNIQGTSTSNFTISGTTRYRKGDWSRNRWNSLLHITLLNPVLGEHTVSKRGGTYAPQLCRRRRRAQLLVNFKQRIDKNLRDLRHQSVDSMHKGARPASQAAIHGGMR